MCCTLQPAQLSDTILYAAETEYLGKHVHVLGYENRAENRFDGPNAMLLPLPSKEAMGPENIINTTPFKKVLKDLSHALVVQTFGSRGNITKGVALRSARSVQVFDSGSYTVVLADNASDIHGALELVPENKRPPMNAEIFDAYAEWYPEWRMALCCFNGKISPEPLLWWFEPKHKEILFAPALDSHNGRPPILDKKVAVDHSVVFGSTLQPTGASVHYRDEIPDNAKPFFSTRIVGQAYGHPRPQVMPNGDFIMSVKRLHESGPDYDQPNLRVDRVPPPSMW
jgi:hypothetical protein